MNILLDFNLVHVSGFGCLGRYYIKISGLLLELRQIITATSFQEWMYILRVWKEIGIDHIL